VLKDSLRPFLCRPKTGPDLPSRTGTLPNQRYRLSEIELFGPTIGQQAGINFRLISSPGLGVEDCFLHLHACMIVQQGFRHSAAIRIVRALDSDVAFHSEVKGDDTTTVATSIVVCGLLESQVLQLHLGECNRYWHNRVCNLCKSHKDSDKVWPRLRSAFRNTTIQFQSNAGPTDAKDSPLGSGRSKRYRADTLVGSV
jgi:hypothetical protein